MSMVTVCLIHSPNPSKLGIRSGNAGVKVSRTLSSYSSVIWPSIEKSLISALFVKRVIDMVCGGKDSKSEKPIVLEKYIYE